MSLKTAIQNKDEKLLKETVDKAVKIYNADAPKEVSVDTVYGEVPFSMVFDEDTKWGVITSAYVSVIQAVDALPQGVDVRVETARIIAQNAILRSIGNSGSADKDSLL